MSRGTMGSVVLPARLCRWRSAICAPCRCAKGIGYAPLMPLAAGITVSKGEGETGVKSEKLSRRGKICMFVHVFEQRFFFLFLRIFLQTIKQQKKGGD